jgi:hypothetical protein
MLDCRSMLVVLCLAASTDALARSSASYTLVVGGTTIASDSKTFLSSGAAKWSNSGSNYTAHVEAGEYLGTAMGYALMSSTANAQTTLTVTSDGSFGLDAPGGSFAGVAGGKVVLRMKLAGTILGTATIAGVADVVMVTAEGASNGSASTTLADQPGPDSAEFEVAVAFPPGLTAADVVGIFPKLTLSLSASTAGGTPQTSVAESVNSFTVNGFRVLNSSGVQVTGFTMTPVGYIKELPPPPSGVARAIEYYNASYGFYFVTSIPQEIADLDSGKTPGWTRTGESFNVYTSGGGNLAAVCRFYGVFGAESSHFYAPRGLGCEALLLANPASVWAYEGDVFFTYIPDASGGCPAGNIPVFRLYNNGQGGAPNHRFTTTASLQVRMIAEGWLAEGNGPGVGMCSPAQ